MPAAKASTPPPADHLDVQAVRHRRTALHELLRQHEFARENRHNLAVVSGTPAIQRVLKLTGVQDMLVLADDPDDLAPPVA
ncbi:MAG: hypothetical protein ABI611_15835 [Solirubrobacteraceae bacterium]